MMNKPKPKKQLIDEGAYCNKEHKDRDLPSKDDHIENDHVYCDWCPSYYVCDESPYYKEVKMTKEELEKEAEEYAFTHWADTDEKGDYLEDDVLIKQAYIASAEPREKQLQEKDKKIAELEAQIEKMKNCKNCKKLKKEKDGLLICTVGSFYTNTFGNNCDKWEIKEK